MKTALFGKTLLIRGVESTEYVNRVQDVMAWIAEETVFTNIGLSSCFLVKPYTSMYIYSHDRLHPFF